MHSLSVIREKKIWEKSMATTVEYIEYVCEQIREIGDIRYKKMFGEYMIYVNDKPVAILFSS